MSHIASAELKTIVVATDLSHTSSAALQYARLLASAYGARVVLAHVIDPVSYANFTDIPSHLIEEMTGTARGEMSRLADQFLAAGIPSHSEVRQGVVTNLLLQVIEQHKADLVVLGTRGAKGLGPMAVGTVAEQLVRRAPCPVMAVAADVVTTNMAGLGGGAILVPLEQGSDAKKALAIAQSLAKHLASSIILLHARTPEEVSAGVDPCAASAKLAAGMVEENIQIGCIVRDGDPSEVITAVAAENAVTMIVLPVNRESRSKTKHGTAYEVITRARTPVLFVPPAEVGEEDLAPDGSAVVAAC
jgi:nucleotide-binding universal stress UspA family protein